MHQQSQTLIPDRSKLIFSYQNFEVYPVSEYHLAEIINGVTLAFLNDNPLSEAEKKHCSATYEDERHYCE